MFHQMVVLKLGIVASVCRRIWHCLYYLADFVRAALYVPYALDRAQTNTIFFVDRSRFESQTDFNR